MQWEWKQSTPLVYLEAAHVVVFATDSPDGLERAHLRPPGVVHDAEVHERPHQVRPEQTQLPRHDGAPIVPHDEHLQREDNLIKKKKANVALLLRSLVQCNESNGLLQ
jgi:hypothetical protein